MSIYGNHPEDRARERELHNYLDKRYGFEDDEPESENEELDEEEDDE